MAFLDNSGDIILDAVLTDTGRKRLARGDGSFRIAKFALADDEIDYNKYNRTHASGSAYYDLEILQTPILEAFTNNTSTMKNLLMTIPRTNLLYLPVIELSLQGIGATLQYAPDGVTSRSSVANGERFLITVDADTETSIFANGVTVFSLLRGFENYAAGVTTRIKLEQGLDTTEISFRAPLSADLVETQYIVEIDNRLGSIGNATGASQVSFIDDDNIASYYFSMASDPNFVSTIGERGENAANNSEIAGPRGTKLLFNIIASLDLQTSTHLFTKFGSSGNSITADIGSNADTFRFIDTNVRVTGATTGYSVDVPVRFVKKQ
jgi:hypothetical protein